MFNKRVGSELVTFEVYDTIYGFTQREWRRVVCVFSCGEPYQIKDWPPQIDTSDPEREKKEKALKVVNLFHRVKGFYIHYQDVLETSHVKEWNVTRMIIQRNKRHHDINV